MTINEIVEYLCEPVTERKDGKRNERQCRKNDFRARKARKKNKESKPGAQDGG